MHSTQKVAVVTGAAHGIGRAIALRLARDGASLCLMDRDIDTLNRLAAEIGRSRARVVTCEVDFLKPAQIETAFAQTQAAFDRVDILVNNVGHSLREAMAPFEELPVEAWDLMLDVCLKPAMACVRQLLPSMKRNRLGKIVNIGSDSAFVGPRANAPYAAAKAGIIGFSRALAVRSHPSASTSTWSRPATSGPEPWKPIRLSSSRGSSAIPLWASSESLTMLPTRWPFSQAIRVDSSQGRP